MENCCMYYKLHVTVQVMSTMLSFLLQDLVTLHRRQEECPPYLLYWGGHPHPLPEPPRVLYYLPMHEGLYKVFWVGCEFHCLDEADCMGTFWFIFLTVDQVWWFAIVHSHISVTQSEVFCYCMTCSFTVWILFCWGVGCCLFCMIMIMKYLFSWFFFYLDDLLIPWVLPLSWSFTSTSHHWCVNSVTYVHINDAIVLTKRSLF